MKLKYSISELLEKSTMVLKEKDKISCISVFTLKKIETGLCKDIPADMLTHFNNNRAYLSTTNRKLYNQYMKNISVKFNLTETQRESLEEIIETLFKKQQLKQKLDMSISEVISGEWLKSLINKVLCKYSNNEDLAEILLNQIENLSEEELLEGYKLLSVDCGNLKDVDDIINILCLLICTRGRKPLRKDIIMIMNYSEDMCISPLALDICSKVGGSLSADTETRLYAETMIDSTINTKNNYVENIYTLYKILKEEDIDYKEVSRYISTTDSIQTVTKLLKLAISLGIKDLEIFFSLANRYRSVLFSEELILKLLSELDWKQIYKWGLQNETFEYADEEFAKLI